MRLTTVFQQLNKLSGAIFGTVLYPIKAILVNLPLFLLFFTVSSLSMAIIQPITFAIQIHQKSETYKIIKALLAGIGMTIVGTLILTGFVTALPYLFFRELIKDIIISIRLGAVDGYKNGLFWHVFIHAITHFIMFSSRLSSYQQTNLRMRAAMMTALRNQDDIIDTTTFTDVPRGLSEPPDLSDLYSETWRSTEPFTPLSPHEIDLTKMSSRANLQVQSLLDRYLFLYEQLSVLDKAILRRGSATEMPLRDEKNEDINNEIMPAMEIIEPVLLVKQYEITTEQWNAIPNSSNLSDEHQLKKWLNVHNTHPLTRDPITKNAQGPALHEGKPTRYRMHHYKDSRNAQELLQAASDLRHYLAALPTPPIGSEVVSVEFGCGHPHQAGFFGSRISNNIDLPLPTPMQPGFAAG